MPLLPEWFLRRAIAPTVPISPEEIVADARRCVDAGATILHLHAREQDGSPTYREEVYRRNLSRSSGSGVLEC